MGNYLTYPTKYMNLSQGYTDGNHADHLGANYIDYPFDEACRGAGRDWFYCPCDAVQIIDRTGYQNGLTNVIWMTSTTPVIMPCGTNYVTIMVVHPNDDTIADVTEGRIYKRGEKMFLEGDDGDASGYHFHISVGLGYYQGGGWRKNGKGKWCIYTSGGAIKPERAFYIDRSFTTVIERRGIPFKDLPAGATFGGTSYTVPSGTGDTGATHDPISVQIEDPVNELIAKYNGCEVWKAGRSYRKYQKLDDGTSVGDLVVYQYKVYACKSDHTSGTAFNPDQWTLRPDDETFDVVPSDTDAEVDSLKGVLRDGIENCNAAINEMQTRYAQLQERSSAIWERMEEITQKLNPSTYFGRDYDELSHYIFEGTYNDDYIVITDVMSNASKFVQYRELYKRTKDTLRRASRPKREFNVSTESFLFEKAFEHMSSQLDTGCVIHADVSGTTHEYEDLFLSGITVNYDDKTISLSFSGDYERTDQRSLYNDILGKIDKSSNSISNINETLEALKSGRLTELMDGDALDKLRLSLQQGIATEDRSVVLDGSGLTVKREITNGFGGSVTIGNNGIVTSGNMNNVRIPFNTRKSTFTDVEAEGLSCKEADVLDTVTTDVLLAREIKASGSIETDGLEADSATISVLNVGHLVVDDAPVLTMSNANFMHAGDSFNMYTTPGVFVHGISVSVNDKPSSSCSGGLLLVYDMAGSCYEEGRYTDTKRTDLHLIQEYRTYNNSGVYKRYVYSNGNGVFFFNPWKYIET